MELALKGRVALITGSSQGIGKAIALALAREGCDLMLCARSHAGLKKTAGEIENGIGTGDWVRCYCLDATDPAAVRAFFSDYVAKLDILVNNVGGGTTKSCTFFDLEDKDWPEIYNLNLLSMVRFVKNALPLLTKSNNGRIINIGSLTGRQPGKFNPHYGAAKAAMLYLNKYLANELAPHGITVNLIAPHSLLGESWERDIQDRAANRQISVTEARAMMTQEVISKIPMGRQGKHEDVANLAVFLASAQANFITGTCIAIDGGTTRSIF